MIKKIGVVIFLTLILTKAISQQLPLGTCGIVNVYDAGGNRTKRVYFCNNGIDPYPAKNGQESPVKEIETAPITKEELESAQIEYVDALFPNPTTGKFSVIFSKQLLNATITVVDNAGKVVLQQMSNGYRVDVDLAFLSAGLYYLRIEENGKLFTKKVVKQ